MATQTMSTYLFLIGNLNQDSDTVVDYYSKLMERINYIRSNENSLKEKFMRGLMPENQEYYSYQSKWDSLTEYSEDYVKQKFIEGLKPETQNAAKCISDFPLDKLVEKLRWIEMIQSGQPSLSESEVPAPVQSDLSVNDYFNLIKVYAVSVGMDLNSDNIKEKFINGLTSNNRMEAIRIGVEKPLIDIVFQLKYICELNNAIS